MPDGGNGNARFSPNAWPGHAQQRKHGPDGRGRSEHRKYEGRPKDWARKQRLRQQHHHLVLSAHDGLTVSQIEEYGLLDPRGRHQGVYVWRQTEGLDEAAGEQHQSQPRGRMKARSPRTGPFQTQQMLRTKRRVKKRECRSNRDDAGSRKLRMNPKGTHLSFRYSGHDFAKASSDE